MGLKSFLKETWRMFRLVKKPASAELTLTLRVVALGLVVLGSVGYAFQLAGSALRGAGAPRIAREVVLAVIAVLILITVVAMFYARRRGV